MLPKKSFKVINKKNVEETHPKSESNQAGTLARIYQAGDLDRDAITVTGQVGGQVGGRLDPISQDFLHRSCVFVCLGHVWGVTCGFFKGYVSLAKQNHGPPVDPKACKSLCHSHRFPSPLLCMTSEVEV